MGENMNQNINHLTSYPWIKLSHLDAPISKIKKLIATYELIKLPIKENVADKKYFYWMSSSAFKYVKQNYPDILEANHACGPGNTFNYISKYVDKSNINIFLSYEDALNTLMRSGDKK